MVTRSTARKKLTDAEIEANNRAAERAEMVKTRRAAIRLLKSKDSKEDLIDFSRLMMPHPEDPDDAELSTYDATYFHRALAAALQRVESGEIRRLIITFPPRHGKTKLAGHMFPAWYVGRDSYRSVAVCTYNQPFADDYGRSVRKIIQSNAYKQVFPDCTLQRGSAAADRLQTEEGGALFFVGRGGTITGRGADLIIIDDPIKNSAEANSTTIREELWTWYQNDIKSRFMSDTGVMIIIQTRWHEDDLVGRITDPTNPHYDEEEARQWDIINIPAIANDNDILGRKPGEPLWPEKFGLKYLENFRRTNPKGFSALYQQEPTPQDGDFFKADMVVKYRSEDTPPLDQLRIYASSDHAVGIKQEHDRTCLLIVGVDQRNIIWILDCWWKRAKTDVVVEQMIRLMRKWKPLTWWAENGHISQSIGPFLYRRMREEKVFVYIKEQTPSKDKTTRAQSIQGRMSMSMVRFPGFEPWYEQARAELLKFPQARHDDFVDTLAHIGMGLEVMLSGQMASDDKPKGPRVGSLAWVKRDANFRNRQNRVLKSLKGM